MGMTTRQRIRRLFLKPKAGYTPEEAAKLIGREENWLWDAMDAGEIEAERAVKIPWTELAELAIQQWSQETVEEVLGERAAEVFPAEVRLTELRVKLPRFQVLTLRRLAKRERRSVSTVLGTHLLDLVSSEELSGTRRQTVRRRAALQWPCKLEADV